MIFYPKNEKEVHKYNFAFSLKLLLLIIKKKVYLASACCSEIKFIVYQQVAFNFIYILSSRLSSWSVTFSMPFLLRAVILLCHEVQKGARAQAHLFKLKLHQFSCLLRKKVVFVIPVVHKRLVFDDFSSHCNVIKVFLSLGNHFSLVIWGTSSI